MEKYLAHDAETGGTVAGTHSLLTHYFGVYTYDIPSMKFTLRAELDLKVKPATGNYVVTAEALSVNKIDLIKHDKEAMTPEVAGEKLYYFLKEHSDDGRNRLIRMGHNEPFDKDFAVNNLLLQVIWNKFTDYGGVADSSSFARFLKMKGKLPWNTRFNLRKLAEFLGVHVEPSELHTAKGDVHLMVRCVEKMLSM